jgi:16S rRNA (cytosine1402-N4)-methyltransferase
MHIPVLLKEVIETLNPQPGQKFIDATVDGGGHAMAVLDKIGSGGKFMGIEWDPELFQNIKAKIEDLGFKNVTLINDSYTNLKTIAEENDFAEADGILFDLGLSSWHLEDSGRGFSFQKDEPLNMRFAPVEGFVRKDSNAEQIVNDFREEQIFEILKNYGEERFAKSIARGIVKARRGHEIKTTFELVEIIKNSVPFWYRRGRTHFATRTFQALRIAANNELGNVETGLKQAEEVLKKGGRVAVISFHSLEDRIVKNFFRAEAKEERLKIITKKPLIGDLSEITENPRARSAKLRVAEKI